MSLRGNVDFGFHSGAEVGGVDGPDVDVFHFIGGVGYLLTDPAQPFFFGVNAGAGAVSFNPDVEGAETETYFAINAGAELGYWVSPNIALFLSPQGDIAFVDEEDLGIEGIDTSWVWPFTAGIKVKLGS